MASSEDSEPLDLRAWENLEKIGDLMAQVSIAHFTPEDPAARVLERIFRRAATQAFKPLDFALTYAETKSVDRAIVKMTAEIVVAAGVTALVTIVAPVSFSAGLVVLSAGTFLYITGIDDKAGKAVLAIYDGTIGPAVGEYSDAALKSLRQYSAISVQFR